jgi:hypothetical protein
MVSSHFVGCFGRALFLLLNEQDQRTMPSQIWKIDSESDRHLLMDVNSEC